RRYEEQREPVVALLDVRVRAGQQEDVVGHVGRRAPRLAAVEHPAAVGAGRAGRHRAEHVRAAARFGAPDRVADLAARRRRQEALLLLVAAVEADALATGERGDPPDPGEAAEGSRQLAREDALDDDVAALAAVLLRDPDAVIAGGGQLLPQVERVLVLPA